MAEKKIAQTINYYTIEFWVKEISLVKILAAMFCDSEWLLKFFPWEYLEYKCLPFYCLVLFLLYREQVIPANVFTIDLFG